jgi:hypothetical protein
MQEDQHGRFPASVAAMVKSGFILRPIVDEYVALLRSWLLRLGYTKMKENSTFRIAPSCDVDIPYFWLRRPRWKVYAAEWMKSKTLRSLKNASQKIKSIAREQEKDPFDQFERMMDKAEAHNLRFDFNMIAGGISRFEGFYSIRDPRIVQLMKKMEQRGHRIGLHPSYNAFHDARQLKEEKLHLENAIGHAITSSRQHYLKFSVPKTWQLLSEAGIREDSTMGYAAEPGFRCGTGKPFPVFDIHQRIPLPLTEHPLLLMDVSLRFYKKYTPAESLTLIDTIRREVKKHDGEFSFIWHNSNLSEVEGWEEWKGVFEYLFWIADFRK